MVQRRLLDPRLRFVSFSVDPDTDTPEVMARYAKLWNANESRWRLLSTDALGLNRLVASMKVEISRTQGDVLHSDRFFLVDARGSVVRSFDSSDDAALDCLLADAGKLMGSAPTATANGHSGGELFSSLGCAGCHGNPQLAPPLAGLLGSHVMLERGDSVEANDDYVRESIRAPAAKCVAGYPNSMPAYGSMLSSAQVDALVGYVRSLRGTPVAEAAARQTDPVCGMPVRVTKDTPSAEYSGRSYHFCSRSCARHFQTDPEKYLHAR
jgi:YHS domain-containing protein/mono/diheme cytochrome c family protein